MNLNPYDTMYLPGTCYYRVIHVSIRFGVIVGCVHPTWLLQVWRVQVGYQRYQLWSFKTKDCSLTLKIFNWRGGIQVGDEFQGWGGEERVKYRKWTEDKWTFECEAVGQGYWRRENSAQCFFVFALSCCRFLQGLFYLAVWPADEWWKHLNCRVCCDFWDSFSFGNMCRL